MNSIASVMNKYPIFCTIDTRIAEVKYLLKKYDFDEMIVLDSVNDKHPVGIITMSDVESESIEEEDIPSDVSAAECMHKVPAVVKEDSSLEVCLDLMRENHLTTIPIVDIHGHFVGTVDRKEIAENIM